VKAILHAASKAV